MKVLVLVALSVAAAAAIGDGIAGVQIASRCTFAQFAGTSLFERAYAEFLSPSSFEGAIGQARAKSGKSVNGAQVPAGDQAVDFILQSDAQFWRV